MGGPAAVVDQVPVVFGDSQPGAVTGGLVAVDVRGDHPAHIVVPSIPGPESALRVIERGQHRVDQRLRGLTVCRVPVVLADLDGQSLAVAAAVVIADAVQFAIIVSQAARLHQKVLVEGVVCRGGFVGCGDIVLCVDERRKKGRGG